MSAIAGIVDFSGQPLDRRTIAATIHAMTDAMAHRGPDGEGCWIDGHVALGARILHSTPESLREEQPLSDAENKLFLVFDGRLDNRDELIRMLAAEDLALRRNTDAEIVLRAYQVWGVTCPARFLGDFAFALWDDPKQTLYAARDQLGMRPLYYTRAGSRFVFASEIGALFKDPHVVREPDRGALARRILSIGTPASETLIQHVFRLSPGSSLVLTDEGSSITQYWQIDTNREIRYRSDDQYAEHFRELLQRSVRCRLRGAGPVATLLSGGIDSASVISTANRFIGAQAEAAGELEAFSISFNGYPECDESEYVRALAAELGIEVTSFAYNPASPRFDFQRAAQFPDVLYDLSHLIYAPALDAIRRRGTKILLAGFGSDELLASGFDHLEELLLQADFAGLLAALRHDSRVYALRRSYLFANYCLKPLIPERIKNLLRLLHDFRRARPPNAASAREVADLATGPETACNPPPSFHQSGQMDIYRALFLGPNATTGNDTMNLFFGRFGVELRCPFLDRRLVEFAFAIPQDQRWRGRQSKFVLRQAMKGVVPDLVRERTAKADISGPIFDALRYRLGSVQALLKDSVLVSPGIVPRHNVDRHLKNCRARSGYRYPYDLQLLIALELWSRSDRLFNLPHSDDTFSFNQSY